MEPKSQSKLSNLRECYICGSRYNLEIHHIFFGNPNRNFSDEDGMWCYLCSECHRGTYGVHGKKGERNNDYLKRRAQMKWEKAYGDTEAFIERYGRSYLIDD